MCGAGGRGLDVDTEEGDGGTITIGRNIIGCDEIADFGEIN
jgi:hypothetical protein